jgi:hypothetical protein
VFDGTKSKNVLKTGLALIANRNMFSSRNFSYPKTFLIYEGSGCKNITYQNLLNYQRVIILSNGWQNNTFHYTIVSVIDISPFVFQDKKIQCKVYHFHLFGFQRQSEDVTVDTSNLLKNYFELTDMTLDIPEEKNYLLKNFLDYHDFNFLAKTFVSPYYNKPINELYFAALYLVDYYSRNLESPSYLEHGTTHDALVYICKNIDKIKTVWNASMHLGILVVLAPVNTWQHMLPVPSDVLDKNRVLLIDKLFSQKQQIKK